MSIMVSVFFIYYVHVSLKRMIKIKNQRVKQRDLLVNMVKSLYIRRYQHMVFVTKRGKKS